MSWQAFASGLLLIFSSDEIIDLLKMEKNSRAAFVALSKGYLASFEKGKTFLTEIRKQPKMASIFESAQRVERFCKCILHIFAEEFEDAESTYADLSFLTKYGGKQALEKNASKYFNLEGSFWADACADIFRCAGQAELLRPQLDEFRSFLETDVAALKGTAALERALALWSNIESGSRKIEVEPLAARFQQRLCEVSKFVMGMDAASVEVGFVDGLLKGLNRFPTIAGSMSTIKNLQGWLVTNRSSIAVTELVQAMIGSTREKVDFEAAMANLSRAREKNVELPSKIFDQLPNFLLKMCHNLLDKACF